MWQKLFKGDSKTPHIFRHKKLFLVKCEANEMLWWLFAHFSMLFLIGNEMKCKERKCIHFFDNFPAHTNARLENTDFFPCKCYFFSAVLLRLMDQGIISFYKRYYRKEVIKIISWMNYCDDSSENTSTEIIRQVSVLFFQHQSRWSSCGIISLYNICENSTCYNSFRS